MLQDLAYISEWIAAIAALIFYKKYRHTPIKTILWILWITVAMETCARIPELFIEGTNHLYYNCYLITTFPLLYFTVYKHTLVSSRQKSIAIISLLTIAVMIIRALTTPFHTSFMLYMYSLAMIVLVINLMIYAVDLLKNNEQIQFKFRLELFIFGGYLIFGVSYIPLSFFLMDNSLYKLSHKAYAPLADFKLVVAIFLYLLFIVGFMWTHPQPRKT